MALVHELFDTPSYTIANMIGVKQIQNITNCNERVRRDRDGKCRVTCQSPLAEKRL